MSATFTDADLMEHARSAREHAYAPYSKFTVGAAILVDSGQVFRGCNVENISFGLTICAERVAVGSAVESGYTKFERLALVSDSDEPVVPCGACRQVLAEFNPALEIVSNTVGGKTATFSLEWLLPCSSQGILG